MSLLLSHVGGRTDLPVPLSFFVIGAGLAIVISFVVLSSSWLEPRLQSDYARRVGPAIPWISGVAAALGAVGLGLVLAGGALNGQFPTSNIAPVLVWIVFWLVVPFASAVVGGLWRWMSPYRRVAHLAAGGTSERTDFLDRFGVWPATVGFVAFVWLELVYPANTGPATLATAAFLYGLYLIGMARWLGPGTALQSAAVFENYTDIISAMAPLEIVTTPEEGPGRIERRSWFAALPELPIRAGTTAFIISMIGTVTYDGMSSTAWWSDLVGDVRREVWFETVALLAAVVAIGALYYAAALAAGRLAASERSVTAIADRFAHTLVPIAFAYAFAHYFTLVIFEGQQLIHNASDPFGRGWNVFGTAEWKVVFGTNQAWVWYVQLIVIVIGHIVGVVLAHDRALADFPREVAVRTQYAMLVLMVGLTSLGLLILAG